MPQIVVGNLHCQHDTYCTDFDTECLNCSEKPDKNGFYEVELQDTILFPEGGGQPSDTGYIGNVQVYHVQRKKLNHVHLTKEPVAVGNVHVKLDWERRWDHVQQHSGQHLLSAVLEKPPFGLETVSWNLGEKRCYVDLAKGSMPVTPELLNEAEQRINALIKQQHPVHCDVKADNGQRPESLPKDYVGGFIRTIVIGPKDKAQGETLDENPCCGTHLRNIGELEALKLLHTETAKGNVRLYFLFGHRRIFDALNSSSRVSRQVNELLSVPPELFAESIAKLQSHNQQHMKHAKKLLEELAPHIVSGLVAELDSKQVAMMYREDVGLDFLNYLSRLIKEGKLLDNQNQTTPKAIVLAAGERSAGGPVIVLGSTPEAVSMATRAISENIEKVKGGGKDRWQGKAPSWKGIDTLKEAFQTLSIQP